MSILVERVETEFGVGWYEPALHALWIVRNHVAADSIGKIDRMFSEHERMLCGIDCAKLIAVFDVRQAPPVKPDQHAYFMRRLRRSMAPFYRSVVILQSAEGKRQQKTLVGDSELQGKLFLFNNEEIAREFVRDRPPPT